MKSSLTKLNTFSSLKHKRGDVNIPDKQAATRRKSRVGVTDLLWMPSHSICCLCATSGCFLMKSTSVGSRNSQPRLIRGAATCSRNSLTSSGGSCQGQRGGPVSDAAAAQRPNKQEGFQQMNPHTRTLTLTTDVISFLITERSRVKRHS